MSFCVVASYCGIHGKASGASQGCPTQWHHRINHLDFQMVLYCNCNCVCPLSNVRGGSSSNGKRGRTTPESAGKAMWWGQAAAATRGLQPRVAVPLYLHCSHVPSNMGSLPCRPQKRLNQHQRTQHDLQQLAFTPKRIRRIRRTPYTTEYSFQHRK